jgi:Domain of unknown function (DUF4276)
MLGTLGNTGAREDLSMSNRGHLRVGIIAEDVSDVDAARVLIRRIARRTDIGFKHFAGKGCGRMKGKCKAWAQALRAKGCGYLILIHDRDRRRLAELRTELEQAISPCPIKLYLICIPVEEMEAWWLADPNAIQKALNLARSPSVKGVPEQIPSPKERIERLVKVCSGGRVLYLTREHNWRIAEHVDLDKVRRCVSFLPLSSFVQRHM